MGRASTCGVQVGAERGRRGGTAAASEGPGPGSGVAVARPGIRQEVAYTENRRDRRANLEGGCERPPRPSPAGRQAGPPDLGDGTRSVRTASSSLASGAGAGGAGTAERPLSPREARTTGNGAAGAALAEPTRRWGIAATIVFRGVRSSCASGRARFYGRRQLDLPHADHSRSYQANRPHSCASPPHHRQRSQTGPSGQFRTT